jgi:hypothetical protein
MKRSHLKLTTFTCCSPVSGTLRRLASDCDERQLRASVQCTKITLDAGADPSIEMVVSNNIPANPFMVTLQVGSVVIGSFFQLELS